MTDDASNRPECGCRIEHDIVDRATAAQPDVAQGDRVLDQDHDCSGDRGYAAVHGDGMSHGEHPAEPTMYCRRCQYALGGLPDNRCPECGTAFDPADPKTFHQTPVPGVWRRIGGAASRRRRELFLVGLVLSAVIIEETCCSWDRRAQVCTHCGARRDVRALSGLGLNWTYKEAVNEGPVSQFVQEIDGRSCIHQWQSYGFAGGGLVIRWLGSGAGSRVWLSSIERSYPDLEILLHKQASMDPTFAPRFLDQIHTDDSGRYEQFLDEFVAWAESQTSRPSDESIGPTSAPG